MAVTTDYGVTFGDVIDETPLSAKQIDATSTIVTTGHIAVWIAEAAGVVNSILIGRGISPASVDLDGDTEMVCIRAIKAFAASKTLAKMNGANDLRAQLWAEYQEALEVLRNSKTDLGEQRISVVKSNINTSSPSPTTWRNVGGAGDGDVW